MKSTKLTKVIKLPLVKGSSWGTVVVNNRLMSAFVGFQFKENHLIKVESFNMFFNYLLNTPVMKTIGYQMFGTEFEAVVKANKYLDKQYARLAKYLENDDTERYTALFEILKNRSEYFLMAFWVNKAKDYKQQISTEKVHYILKEIRNKLRSENTKLKFKRVYLEELNPDGSLKKLRPLGVPEVQWRVIAGMYEFYLVNLLKKDWEENQYACMPKRGVVDAWIDILQRINSYDIIVGIDLAKFFDTVYLEAVRLELLHLGVPHKIVEFINGINNCTPLIKPQDKAHEEQRIQTLNIEAPIKIKSKPGFWEMPNERNKGLPQGLNTSPLLACMVLNGTRALKGFLNKSAVVQYMDDAVLFGDLSPDIEIEDYKKKLRTSYNGITLSEKKTEIIKARVITTYNDGRPFDSKVTWIKPLKFLGCEYDGSTFRAHTRKNGIIEIPNASNRITEIIKWLEENRGNIKDYDRSKLSKLINEGWNNEEYLLGQPGPEKWLGLAHSRKALWEKYRVKLTKVSRGSVEWRVIEKYRGTGNPCIHSTNTMSMLCAGTLLNSSFTNINNKKVPGTASPSFTMKAVWQIAGYVSGILLLFQLLILWIKNLASVMLN